MTDEKTKSKATVLLIGDEAVGRSAMREMILRNDSFICIVQDERKERFETTLELLAKKRDEIDQISPAVFLRALFGVPKTTAEIIKDENDQERKVFNHTFGKICNAVIERSDGAILIKIETAEEQIEALKEAINEVCSYCQNTREVPTSSTNYIACPKCCQSKKINVHRSTKSEADQR